MGPEQQRLIDRLCNDPTRKLLNFHVTRGDEPCTAEELCREINSALDQVENGTATRRDNPPESKRRPRPVSEIIAELERDVKS